MTWTCKTGNCSFAIPEETAIGCVCASLAMGKITQTEIEKLEMVERLRVLETAERDRVKRSIEETAKALPELIEKLNRVAA